MEDQVPAILEHVFECTLDMINKDFSEYPEHRVQFFNMLRAINLYCFPALLRLDGRQFKLVIDSCMWASKHDNRDVESAGLNMCMELMNNMAETDSSTCNAFFQNFFTSILQDVFFVLCDADHKAGFKYQSQLLARMFSLVESGRLSAPIYAADKAPAGTSNKDFLREFTQSLLANAFQNLQATQIASFVEELFKTNNDLPLFRLRLRDFLISMKEYSAGDHTEMFAAEDREDKAEAQRNQDVERARLVGGLMKPADMDDDEL